MRYVAALIFGATLQAFVRLAAGGTESEGVIVYAIGFLIGMYVYDTAINRRKGDEE